MLGFFGGFAARVRTRSIVVTAAVALAIGVVSACFWPDDSHGCPPRIPTIGEACSTPDYRCTYALCSDPNGLGYACADGAWKLVDVSPYACCPREPPVKCAECSTRLSDPSCSYRDDSGPSTTFRCVDDHWLPEGASVDDCALDAGTDASDAAGDEDAGSDASDAATD